MGDSVRPLHHRGKRVQSSDRIINVEEKRERLNKYLVVLLISKRLLGGFLIC